MGADDRPREANHEDANLEEIAARQRSRSSWWSRHWLKVCLTVLFAWTSLGFFLGFNERTDRINAVQNFSIELRNGLVASCEKNGNPLREAVIGMLREEIRQTNPKLLKEFFPQIPPSVLEHIVNRQKMHKHAVIREIRPVDCEALYPKPTPR